MIYFPHRLFWHLFYSENSTVPNQVSTQVQHPHFFTGSHWGFLPDDLGTHEIVSSQVDGF